MADADKVQPSATAQIINPDGEGIGEATLWQGPHGVLIHVELAGLSPGKHAIHLHAVGACEPDFGASKGHINIWGAKHGLLNPEGPDNGDLPNLSRAKREPCRRSSTRRPYMSTPRPRGRHRYWTKTDLRW